MSTSESKVVLVTGAGSGIGRLSVRAPLAKGHHVFVGIRAIAGRNAGRAAELRDYARETGLSGCSLLGCPVFANAAPSDDTSAATMLAPAAPRKLRR